MLQDPNNKIGQPKEGNTTETTVLLWAGKELQWLSTTTMGRVYAGPILLSLQIRVWYRNLTKKPLVL